MTAKKTGPPQKPARPTAPTPELESREAQEEDTLRESERRYRSLFDQASEGLFLMTMDGRLAEVNRAFAAMHGYSADELKATDIRKLDVLKEHALQDRADILRRIGAGETVRFEVEHYHKDGHVFPLAVTTSTITIGSQPFYLAFHQDLTERKRAEAALRESEERFRSVYEDATLGLYRTTPEGRILLANPALVRMLGYASFEDLAARNLEHRDAYEPTYSRAEFLQRIDASGEVRGLESVWRRKDGTTLTVRENARAVHDASGQLLYLDGVVEDITESKRAEEALTNALALIEATLDSTANGVLVVSLEGAVLKANRRFAELWRIPDDVLASGDDGKLVGHVLSQLSDPDAFLAGVKALYGDPRAESADQLAFKDGRVFERTSRPMLVAGEPKARVWSFLDVTARQEAEKARETLQAQLLQAQKVESLGRMAGAIAHNYNNILGVVLLHLELALTKLPADSGARKNIAEATKASQRAAEISHQMLAYLGQVQSKRQAVDLGALCREALAPLPSSLPATVRFTTAFPAEGVTVRADPAQLGQALMFLAENASEAIGAGDGSIAVTIGVLPGAAIAAPRFYPAHWTPTAGTYACLSVADTGCGMTPEILDRVFDPFFSTKFTGRGLGLPVVMGIARAHEGACTVESSQGQGTTVRVFLPVVAE